MPKAITAAAHKLPRIICHVLTTREPCNPAHPLALNEQARLRAENRVRKQTARPGHAVAPYPGPQEQTVQLGDVEVR